MTIEKHDLVHDLPQFKDRIHALKTSDAHFAKLFAEYHEVDHEVRRIEQELETPGDEYVENLKTRRVRLKDQLYTRLNAAH
ncbi:DUF465 domain-containing protein [Stagnimonas aquatica]|uniref:DUF465 domain-containing protein n=1 Tax=Stagnimonas aquatica TaxID=2689987 RepID=A0A3N0VMX7_9GAMM|nr:YdcH family protein [Stagnimonas aquatica]ROH93348.1 DUF465 domain-containing protein [Stagnimonas aquatica]